MHPPIDSELTPSEQVLQSHLSSGNPADFGSGDPRDISNPGDWAPERRIRGAILADLLLDLGASKSNQVRTLTLRGVVITGQLQIEHAEVLPAVNFERCFFEGSVGAQFSRFNSVRFHECHLEAIDAQCAHFTGVLAITSSIVRTSLRFVGANVKAFLTLRGTNIRPSRGDSVNAERISVGQSLLMDQTFRASGKVHLTGATIGGDLVLAGGQFHNPSGTAIEADSIRVVGNLFMSDSFQAFGEVRLIDANIAGQFKCSAARFHHPDGIALFADSVSVKGHVMLDQGVRASGKSAISRGEDRRSAERCRK